MHDDTPVPNRKARDAARAVWAALAGLHSATGEARFAALFTALQPAIGFRDARVVFPEGEAHEHTLVVDGPVRHSHCPHVEQLPDGEEISGDVRAFRIADLEDGSGSALVISIVIRGQEACLVLTHPTPDFFDAAAVTLLNDAAPLIERLLRKPRGARLGHDVRTPLNVLIGMAELLLDTPLDEEQTEFAEAVRRNTGALAALLDDRDPVAADPAPQTQSTRALTILVVEDSPDNQAVMRAHLERLGHTAVLCADGREGLARAKQGGLDAVIMDLRLPGISGLEATRLLREWESESGRAPVPVIACTAEPPSDARGRAMRAGCTGFLSKPTPRTALVAALAEAVPAPTVLVVDDDADSLRLMAHFLQREGYSVRLAEDGESGLDALSQAPADLLLMDIEMPGMGGEAAIRRLRDMGSSIRALAVTGHTKPAVHTRLVDAGFDGVVTKPVRRAILTQRVREALESPERAPEADAPVAEVQADLAPLIPAFLADRRDDCARITADLEAGRWEQIRRAGHSMKGTGSAYGFPPISSFGAKIEAAAEREDTGEVRDATSELETYLETVRIKYA